MIMNPCIFGTKAYSYIVAYSEPWNIHKFYGISIPVKHIAMSLGNSSSPQLFFVKRSFLDYFRSLAGF